MVVAGTDGYKANIRIVNNRDKVVKSCYPEEGKFTQVSFVKTPRSKVTGFVAGTDRGNLMIFSYPF